MSEWFCGTRIILKIRLWRMEPVNRLWFIYTVVVIGHSPIVKKKSLVKIPRKSMLEIQGRLTTSWILETDVRWTTVRWTMCKKNVVFTRAENDPEGSHGKITNWALSNQTLSTKIKITNIELWFLFCYYLGAECQPSKQALLP